MQQYLGKLVFCMAALSKVLEIALTYISAHVGLKKALIRRLVVQLMACDLVHDMY